MSEQLIDRIRAELADRQTRETKMFGGLAFMVDEAMAVSVGKDALLVRVDYDRYPELITRPGARPAMMGADRPMGTGWLEVDEAALADDEALRSWLDEGLAAAAHGR